MVPGSAAQMVTWVARATAKEAHCPVNAAIITSSTGKRRRMYRELTSVSMAQVHCAGRRAPRAEKIQDLVLVWKEAEGGQGPILFI